MTAGGEGGRRPAGRRRRTLAPEEAALWEHVTRSVHRLRPAPPPPDKAAAANEPPSPPGEAERRPAPAPPPVPAPLPARPPLAPLAPLEPKMRRRLSRGAEVDARLDLHGLTQAAAHSRLIGFLRGAQSSGHSLVLVITGKGAPGEAGAGFHGEGRGVLRRLVPQWLAAPDLRAVVIGFETAGRGHGGEGALYVRVRRAREGGR